MFIATPFTIASTWKQPACPSTEEWIKTMWCIYTMEYYSARKRNGIVPFAETWVDLETVIHNEVKGEKQIPSINTYVWTLENKMERLFYLQRRSRDMNE